MGISQICQTIKNYFANTRPPVERIPTLLLACSLVKRPGLSTITSVANIVKDLNMLGINTGPMPDGSPNLTVAYTYAVVNEIYRALKMDSVVQVAINPNSINVVVGGNMGTNPMPVDGSGITR